MPTFTPKRPASRLDQAKKCVNPVLKAHQLPKRSKRAQKPLKNQLRRVSNMPAHKGSKVLGTLRGGPSAKGGTAPVARKTGTYGPRTTDPKMVGKPTLSNTNNDPNNTYTRAMGTPKPKPKPKTPPVISAAERAAIANRDPARARAAMRAVAREGTTSAAGGRSAKPVQVTRTTTNMKPTPPAKKKK